MLILHFEGGGVLRPHLSLTVEAPEPEQRVVSPLEIRLAVFQFHGSELSPQDLHEKVPTPARRFQETRVNALRLALQRSQNPWQALCYNSARKVNLKDVLNQSDSKTRNTPGNAKLFRPKS